MKTIKILTLSLMVLNCAVSIYYHDVLGVGGWLTAFIFAYEAYKRGKKLKWKMNWS